MSVLSDKDIKKKLLNKDIVISPCDMQDIQPASVDLHLGSELKKIDGAEFILTDTEDVILKPHEFILGSTLEFVELSDDLVARVEGRSSIGRYGITAHITAGYIDPGFRGNITLEIANVSDKDFVLKKDMSICQIVFESLSSPCERPYGSRGLGSKYQDSEGTILSRYVFD